MVRNTLTFISLLFLAAHGLRSGDIGATLFWLLTGVLAVSTHAWKKPVLAILLLFGTWLWTDICITLVQMRMEYGLPWIRMVMILMAISAFTLLAAILNFRGMPGEKTEETIPSAAVFFIILTSLLFIRYKAPFAILLPDRFFHGGGYILAIVLGWYGAYIYSKIHNPASTARTRLIIWSLFSAVFFFQLGCGLAGFDQFLMSGKLHLPVPALIAAGPLYRGEGLFMIILFSTTVLLVGPAWCSHLCYIGVWDNLMSHATGKVTPLPGWAKYLRWIICLGVFGLAYLLRINGLSSMYAIILASLFGIVGILIMLLCSRKMGIMVHCTVYCPMGLVANLLGKITPWRITISEQCTTCGLCFRSCRYNALNQENLDNHMAGLSCTLCGDCISSCPKNHLSYHLPGFNGDRARTIFLVLVVSLHSIFMGVARL